jgi:beta-glucosidase
VAGFLEWLEKAIDEGFDIRGYYLWSLMDNFEWSAAYNFKFGIATTDFATGETKWKKSAYFYRDFIQKVRENAK